MAAPTEQGIAPADESVIAPAETAKRKPGRPKKATTTTVTETVGDVSRTETTVTETDATIADVSATATELYVDCIPSKPYTNLDNIVSDICAAIVSFFKTDACIDDVRALTDRRADFGKWKGVVNALTREMMAEGKIPTGPLYLRVKGDDLRREVAEGLIASKLLSMYVWGV